MEFEYTSTINRRVLFCCHTTKSLKEAVAVTFGSVIVVTA